MKSFSLLLATLLWVAGLRVTTNFTDTVLAFVLPPVSYYHLVSKAMEVYTPEMLR